MVNQLNAIVSPSLSRPETRSRFSHPQFAGAVSAASTPRITSSDEAMTRQTIGLMRQYAVADSSSPIVRRAAMDATQGTATAAEAAAGIWKWIRQRVRFQSDAQTAAPFAADPDQAEILIRPVDLLTMPRPSGDCDDFSMLVVSMLLAVGIDSEFTTVAADAADPQTYSHVYVTAKPDGQRLPLDASHGTFAGWEVQARGKRRNWKVRAPMIKSLKGYDFETGDWTSDPAAPSSTDWIYGLTSNPPAPKYTPASSGGTFDINSLVSSLTKTTGGILTAQFGVPQVPTGTYIQNAQGVMYRQPAGSASLNPVGAAFGSSASSGSLMLMGVLAVGAVLVFSMMGKR